MKRGFVLSLAAVLALLALTAPAASARVDRAGAAAKLAEGQKLANQVVGKKNFARSVKATQRILALSGISTVREGTVIVPGIAPLSRWKMTARETVLLARGARTPIVSFGEISRRMSQAGVKVGGRAWTSIVPEMFNQWVFESTLAPTDPLSQPALFVQQMQVRQASKVPLFNRMSSPSKMTFSALEALVVFANIERVLTPGTPPEPAPEPEENYDEEYEEEPVASAAQEPPSGGPCGKIKEAIKSLGPEAEAVTSFVISEGTGKALGAYADQLGKGGGDELGKLTTALDVIDRVVRTTAFALNLEVIVLPAIVNGDKIHYIEDGKVHKRTDGSRRNVWFFGAVGLDDFAREALKGQLELAKEEYFQDSMRQCAELHGITIPKVPYGDLAAEMTDWRARWTAHWRTEELRVYPPLTGQLKRLDDTSAYSLFKVGVEWENPKYHGKKGQLEERDWQATVEISAQKPPNAANMVKLAIAIGTLGAPGDPKYSDFAGPIAELMEGMYRTIAKPTGTGTLTVEEHIKNICVTDRGSEARASC